MSRMRAVVLSAVLSLALLAGCGGPRRSLLDPTLPVLERPSHFGLSLPYPISAIPYVTDTVPAAANSTDRLVPVTLQIDIEGRVAQVQSETAGDSLLVARYAIFLNEIRFEHGLSDGIPAPMPLSILLQAGGGEIAPIVHFPVGPNRMVMRPDLYWRAFEKFGIHTAALVSFPSYYYLFEEGVRWKTYATKIFRVDLDSAGTVTAVDLVRADSPRFNDQIRSAINWAEYSPMVVDGRAVPSTNYLIVSLYPMMKYPTRPWKPTVNGGDAPWDRSRVQLLPDTIGLLAPPIPKRIWGGEEDNPFYFGLIPDLVSARIAVDTLGDSRLTAVSTDVWRARRVLNTGSHDIRFFPAIDFAGRKYPYLGLVFMRYLDESNVRVWFDWLGGIDPGLPAQDAVGQ